MSEVTRASNGGVGFLGMLTILFIGLKLTGHIDWSWWWVVSPLWIPFAVVFGGAAAFFLLALLYMGLAGTIGWFLQLFIKKS